MVALQLEGLTSGDLIRDQISRNCSPSQKALFYEWLDEYLSYLQDREETLTFVEWLRTKGPRH